MRTAATQKPLLKYSVPAALVALVATLALVGFHVASAQAAQRTLLEQQAAQAAAVAAAYEKANLDALAVRTQGEALATELAQESRQAAQSKASALAAAQREAAQKSKGGGAVYIPPAGFQAGAYGYTGADQIAYWRSINSDVIGWLRVPGTNINHPIVQDTTDVNYYTARGYDKQYSYYGVIWTNPSTVSGSSSQLSSNTVLYGHNWTNYGASPRIGNPGDIMFGQLTGYHWLSQAQSYPYFYYSTPQEQMTFKIFAAFYTEVGFAYNTAEGNMGYIIGEALARSRHNFGVDVNASDKIVTLSTCTRAYGATNQQRFVVMGRLLRPGEGITEVNVTSNPNHKQPSLW